MIDRVRSKIFSFEGKTIKFRYNGSRNQVEEFEGIILKCYNYVFVVSVQGVNRAFSYSDVLIGTLEVNI
ncbi:MAG: Veg family protein [bacterium]|nr:Veg family protein [bacterium]